MHSLVLVSTPQDGPTETNFFEKNRTPILKKQMRMLRGATVGGGARLWQQRFPARSAGLEFAGFGFDPRSGRPVQGERKTKMKILLTQAPRLRVALALALMLVMLPVASIWNVSEAQPRRHAPAYGYRRKTYTKRVVRYRRPQVWRRTVVRRYRSDNRPTTRRTYRSTRTYRR
jgi:hypothetical protein